MATLAGAGVVPWTRAVPGRADGGDFDKSPSWVMLTVQLFQALTSHVRVDLCRRQVTMTQQHLHDAQVGTMVEQMRGKRVSQSMRRKVFGDSGLAGVALDDVPERLARHAIATPRGKQVVSLALEQNLAARAAGKLRQPAHRFLTQGNQPLAVSLAEYANDALIDVDLPMAQVDELRNAQARSVQNLEHRT